jgi:hypothetical protein
MLVVFLAGVLVFAIYNLRSNENFFEASLFQVALLVIPIGITYYLTQRKLDERKKKDILERLIAQTQEAALSEELLRFSERKSVLGQQRHLGNKVSVLVEFSASLPELTSESLRIKELYEEIREILDDAIARDVMSDTEKFEAENKAQKVSRNISLYCDKMLLKIYK